MKNILKTKWFNWALVVGWMIFIFYLSSIPQFPVQFEDPWASYISYSAHIFLYLVLTFLLIRALSVGGLSLKKSISFAFLITITFGATDEFHQFFVPYRSMDIKDWLVDTASALVVVYFYNYIYKLKMLKAK